nr:hypothetical protein [Enterobacter mori]
MATVNEQLRDEAISHAIGINRFGTGIANRMLKILNASDADISAKLIVALENLSPESFTVRRLESLLGDIRSLNRQAIDSMFSAMSGELHALAGYEAGYQISLFDSLLPDIVLKRHPLQGITADMVYAATMSQPFQGRLLSEWAEGLETDRMTRIVNAVRHGYLQGETTEAIARRVRGHANKVYKDGALQMSRANATSIVKSAVNHLAATARQSFAKANSDVIECKQWLSTLDNKTTPLCMIRDRRKYTLENKPIGHKVPYLQGPGRIHFCCRSTETLVVKSWRQLGIDVDEMDAGTRASMDGQVPAGITYNDWLLSQSFTRQVQVLGDTRARLIRDGGMRPDEFYTDKGEWLTLEQLREYDSKAFEAAGL